MDTHSCTNAVRQPCSNIHLLISLLSTLPLNKFKNRIKMIYLNTPRPPTHTHTNTHTHTRKFVAAESWVDMDPVQILVSRCQLRGFPFTGRPRRYTHGSFTLRGKTLFCFHLWGWPGLWPKQAEFGPGSGARPIGAELGTSGLTDDATIKPEKF